MRTKNKLVYSVGVNDADYETQKRASGSKSSWYCPYYKRWSDILKRCYSEKYQASKLTYIGCSVCEDWLTFSNFKSWMEQQDWEGKHLDKDIIKRGNKVYSPEFCVFVGRIVNVFMNSNAAKRGEYPLGVSWDNRKNSFIGLCCNPFTKKQERLGYFNCPNEAHKAWKARKHEHACALADIQTNTRVAEALRIRYI
jgi:hypothetical protein